MDQLPFDQTLIQRILPHRFPFLLVDRITEFEPDKRIVGIKNVSLNEQCLAREPGQTPTLPPTMLTEAVAQVGAIRFSASPRTATSSSSSWASRTSAFAGPSTPATRW